MPNRNLYLPKDLDEKAKELGISLSSLLQEAIRQVIETETKCCSRCGIRLPASGPVEEKDGGHP